MFEKSEKMSNLSLFLNQSLNFDSQNISDTVVKYLFYQTMSQVIFWGSVPECSMMTVQIIYFILKTCCVKKSMLNTLFLFINV